MSLTKPREPGRSAFFFLFFSLVVLGLFRFSIFFICSWCFAKCRFSSSQYDCLSVKGSWRPNEPNPAVAERRWWIKCSGRKAPPPVLRGRRHLFREVHTHRKVPQQNVASHFQSVWHQQLLIKGIPSWKTDFFSILVSLLALLPNNSTCEKKKLRLSLHHQMRNIWIRTLQAGQSSSAKTKSMIQF